MCIWDGVPIVREAVVKKKDAVIAYKTLSASYYRGMFHSPIMGEAWEKGKLTAHRPPSSKHPNDHIGIHCHAQPRPSTSNNWVEVKLWGAVVEHQAGNAHGYRAQHAQVVRVLATSETHADLLVDHLADLDVKVPIEVWEKPEKQKPTQVPPSARKRAPARKRQPARRK